MAALVSCCGSGSTVLAQSSRDPCARKDQSPAATSSVVSLRTSFNPKPTPGVSSKFRDAVWSQIRNSRPFLLTHAIGPSGVGPVPTSTTYEGPSDEATTAIKEDDAELEDLKQMLVDNFFGTERGLRASSETRGEIVEIITQLEAKNPTPAPTDALTLLDGKWILAYTSNSELYPLLVAGNLPLVKVGEISQTVDSIAFTVQNKVSFTSPVASTSFSNSGIFEVRSPKRVQVKFQEGVIGTPQLTDSIEIPESVNVLGQEIDLSAFQGILGPLQDVASNVASTVAGTISGQPPVKFPIQAEGAQSWLLTTYLDEDLRISRGDGGGLFVLLKEGSPLLL